MKTGKKDIYGRTEKEIGEKNFIPFRFQGQYEDEEIGLYYNRFRYYSPGDGVYTQTDPIRLAGNNPTLYSYVSNSNKFVDPFGLHETLSDLDIVVRGGQCTADLFTNGTGVVTDTITGKLSDISTQAVPSGTLEKLSQPFKNGKVGVTTVGKIEQAGGEIILDGKLNSKSGTKVMNHATVNGITAEQAEDLFKTQENPIPKAKRGPEY